MRMIYEPKGRAREYSELALNIYKGCSHGCLYCWAPRVLRRTREDFHGNPTPRTFSMEGIQKEAKKLSEKGYTSPVLLCLTCDPYQHLDGYSLLTRETIRAINAGGLPVQILTKGGRRSTRDFDLLKKNPNNCYAATLTCENYGAFSKWEPNASEPDERIDALRGAHQLGIKTWVNFEPVLDPDDVYTLIMLTHEFVDFYKVGKLNYHPLAKKIDWDFFRGMVPKIFERYGKEYYIQNDLTC